MSETERPIWDDDGEEMKAGDTVLVNGTHTGKVYFDEDGQIAVSGWNMNEDLIFSLEKASSQNDQA